MPSVSANVAKVIESLSIAGISQEDMIDSLLTAANQLAAKSDAGLSGGPSFDSLTDQLAAFVTRYPLDERAQEYLTNSPSNVITTVISSFRPPREGEADYSGLLTSFLKRTRQQMEGQSFPHSGKGDLSNNRFSMFPQGKGSPAMASFKGGGKSSGGKGRSTLSSSSAASLEVQQFVQRYPIDDRALEYLISLPEGAQSKILRDFKPKFEGEGDYSGLVTSYIKRVITQGYALEENTSSALGTVPPDLQSAKWTPGFDEFLAKYPIDERAYDYFANSSPAVQARVIKDFNPPREGEASYSGLFTSFVKRIRQQIQDSGGGIGESFQGGPQLGPMDIENFFQRYPCDERSREYLNTSPASVMIRVLNEFKPRREGDADYSAVLTSFIKRTRGDVSAPSMSGYSAKRARFS